MLPVNAFFVMVASPSDVPQARQAVHESLVSWNETHTRTRHIALVPLMWERNAVPNMGGDGQSIINSQLVDNADIVIALFGNRLGQETERALSGTAEEINRAHEAGKPLHVYFSDAPIPRDSDLGEVTRLREFQKSIEGLYDTFQTPDDLKFKVWTALEYDLATLQGAAPAPQKKGGVDFLAQPGMERLPKTDSKGRLKYDTKHWVDLTNRGDQDAENVMVTAANDNSGFYGVLWERPSTIHAGQARRINLLYTMATTDPRLQVTWTEEGEEKEKVFDVG